MPEKIADQIIYPPLIISGPEWGISNSKKATLFFFFFFLSVIEALPDIWTYKHEAPAWVKHVTVCHIASEGDTQASEQLVLLDWNQSALCISKVSWNL